MKLLNTLRNPLVLVSEGFALGAALFFATHPETGRELAEMTFAEAPAPAVAEAIL
jgi:hypothetical protein